MGGRYKGGALAEIKKFGFNKESLPVLEVKFLLVLLVKLIAKQDVQHCSVSMLLVWPGGS